MQRMLKDLKMKVDFEEVKRQAGVPDRIHGYRMEKDYEKPDEFQMSMLNCPNFEKAKEHGLETEICRLICDSEAERAAEFGVEMTILSRIADGAEKCTLLFRKK